MIPNNNPLVPDYIEVFYAPIRESLQIQVLLLAVCLLIVFDVVFGMAAAAKNSEFDSAKVRQGLWHKTGELVLILLAMVIDTLILAGITVPFDIPDGSAVIGLCIGLIVMEGASLLEIAAKLNENLAKLPIFNILKSTEKLKDILKSDEYVVTLDELKDLEAEDDGEDQQ